MTKSKKNTPMSVRDSGVWANMIMLSLVSLSGMAVLMAIIIWQMHGNVINERKQLIRSQVVSTLAMVEKIYADHKQGAMSETDAKHMALTTIAAMKYPDSGYFWILDDKGKMLMHPYSLQLIGRSTIDLRDAHGRPFVREFLVAARSGGGFAAYDWPRPAGGSAAAKIAYVMPFKPWNWVIGSGLYVDDLRTAAIRQISMGAVLIFLLFGINVAISLHLSRRYLREFHDNAIHDVATGLYTRRYLDEIGARMMSRSKIAGEPRLAAIFLDLDHFKQVNDNHGHKAGDTVLNTLGRILRKSLRPNDLAFRYGGEEIVILLHASEKDCRNIAERIRAAFGEYDFNFTGNGFKVSLSAGIALSHPDESFPDLIRRADMCMYTAKKRGRDCTVTESEMDASAGIG